MSQVGRGLGALRPRAFMSRRHSIDSSARLHARTITTPAGARGEVHSAPGRMTNVEGVVSGGESQRSKRQAGESRHAVRSGQLDDQPIALAVLPAGQDLDGLVQFALIRNINHPCETPECPILHTPMDVRIRQQVLNPLRSLEVLRNDVIAPVPLCEPDLDPPRQPGPASGCCQIQVLRLVSPGHGWCPVRNAIRWPAPSRRAPGRPRSGPARPPSSACSGNQGRYH